MIAEFKVSDVFKVEPTKGITNLELKDGTIPYITSSTSNNGQVKTCGNIDRILKGNCITVSIVTGSAFYQSDDFVTNGQVSRLSREGLTFREYLYIAAVLNLYVGKYSFSDRCTTDKIKERKIHLPVIQNETPGYKYKVDDIDWKYMGEYISKMTDAYMSGTDSDLDVYLKVANLESYELTEEDKKILALQKKL